MNTLHAKFIITEPEILKPMLEAKHDVPKENIFIFNSMGQTIPNGFKGWKTLLEHGEVDWYAISPPPSASFAYRL